MRALRTKLGLARGSKQSELKSEPNERDEVELDYKSMLLIVIYLIARVLARAGPRWLAGALARSRRLCGSSLNRRLRSPNECVARVCMRATRIMGARIISPRS